VKRPLRAWCLDALLAVGAVVVALVCGELGLRLFHPQPLGVWHQDRDGLALHWPGLVTYLPQFGQAVSINSAGMRDREHTVPKVNGMWRILILGDSFMEALQVPFDASFPSMLERELGKTTQRPVEVVNASVSGWGTDDELMYLQKYGASWEPDLILIAITLHNDLKDNLRERFHKMENGALTERQRTPLSAQEFRLLELKGFLASRSHAYQLFTRYRQLRERSVEAGELNSHVVDLFRPTTSPELARGVEITRLLLKRIFLIAVEQKAKVVVVLLPLTVQLSGEVSDRPQRLLRGVAQGEAIEVIDLLPQFREWTAAGGPSLYLEHDGHWSESGHGVAAGVVASELVRRGFVKTVTNAAYHRITEP